MSDTPYHDLEKKAVRIADLALFDGNPRRGDIAAIAESLRELGQFRPVVVNRGTLTGRANEILAGNHTVQAAADLGWDTVDAVYVDVDDATAKKIVLADNRTSDLATYDDTDLVALLEDLGSDQLVGTGWTEDDYDDMVDTVLLPEPLEATTPNSGNGKATMRERFEWGFASWRSTKAIITAEEVTALDEVFEAYCDVKGVATGFGWWLARIDTSSDEQIAARVLERRALGLDRAADDLPAPAVDTSGPGAAGDPFAVHADPADDEVDA